MASIARKFLSRMKWAALLLACSGCTVPKSPVPTIWQRLGIPQAEAGFRSGVLNRSGNFPQLEKKPPLLPISDPQNLASENPLLANAAKIKQDKDLKPQKIKALKYLASVGCVCPTEKDDVAEALLQGLNDCDCEVRAAALEAICAAIKNCGPCGSSGCGSSCCTKAIQDKLKEMATKQDDKGCWSEPSAALRRQAAAVLAACPPLEEKKSESKSEDIEPEVEKAADEPAEGSEASASDKTTAAVYQRQEILVNHEAVEGYGEVEVYQVVYSTPQPTSSESVVHHPNLVTCQAIETLEAVDQLKITLSSEYRLEVGSAMVIVDSQGSMVKAQLLSIDRTTLVVQLENADLKSGLVERGGKIGLVAK